MPRYLYLLIPTTGIAIGMLVFMHISTLDESCDSQLEKMGKAYQAYRAEKGVRPESAVALIEAELVELDDFQCPGAEVKLRDSSELARLADIYLTRGNGKTGPILATRENPYRPARYLLADGRIVPRSIALRFDYQDSQPDPASVNKPDYSLAAAENTQTPASSKEKEQSPKVRPEVVPEIQPDTSPDTSPQTSEQTTDSPATTAERSMEARKRAAAERAKAQDDARFAAAVLSKSEQALLNYLQQCVACSHTQEALTLLEKMRKPAVPEATPASSEQSQSSADINSLAEVRTIAIVMDGFNTAECLALAKSDLRSAGFALKRRSEAHDAILHIFVSRPEYYNHGFLIRGYNVDYTGEIKRGGDGKRLALITGDQDGVDENDACKDAVEELIEKIDDRHPG